MNKQYYWLLIDQNGNTAKINPKDVETKETLIKRGILQDLQHYQTRRDLTNQVTKLLSQKLTND